MTASVLHKIDPSALIQFGGDLRQIGDEKSFAEVDIILLSNRGCTFAECKDYDQLKTDLGTKDKIDRINESLQRVVEAAAKLKVDSVVLGITTRSESSDLHQMVEKVANDGAISGIEVDLVLNGKLFLHGTRQMDLRQISIVPVSQSPSKGNRIVGELRDRIGFGLMTSSFNAGLPEQWAEEMFDHRTGSGLQ